MPIRWKKDKRELLIQLKTRVGKKHYFHTYLWRSREAMLFNVNGNSEEEPHLCACFCPTDIVFSVGREWDVYIIDRPKIGEVHFVKDLWNLEVVVHELCHVLMHRFKTMAQPNLVLTFGMMNPLEESICYDFGIWVDKIYRALWEVNPNPKWKEVGGK